MDGHAENCAPYKHITGHSSAPRGDEQGAVQGGT
jgi:hypothetical protein